MLMRSRVRARLFMTLVSLVPLMAVAWPSAAADYQTQVWGGERVDEGEYSAVALLDYRGDGHVGVGCSGTLISPRHILTAGHCLADVPGHPITVLLGGTDASEGFKEKFTSRVHAAHPKFNASNGRYDFGVIVLPKASDLDPEDPATHRDVEHLMDAGGDRIVGTPARVVGWGGISDTARNADVLRAGPTAVRSDESCQRRFGSFNGTSMLCVDGSEVSGCPGDSGGPLFVENSAGGRLQVGVTSFGEHGCNQANPRWVAGWVPASTWWVNKTADVGIPTIKSVMLASPARKEVSRGAEVRIRAFLAARSFAGLGFQHVQLQRRRVDSTTWKTIQTRQTRASGAVSFFDTPPGDVFYRVRHRGSAVTTRSVSWRSKVEVTR